MSRLAPDDEATGCRPLHKSEIGSQSQQLMRSWCPQAIAGGARRPTEAQARGCLRQVWDAWLRELRRNDHDPGRVGC